MSDKNGENSVVKSKCLLNSRHSSEPNIFQLFSSVKNFVLDQEMNRRNDAWFCTSTIEDFITKFSLYVMVLEVVNNGGYVMPSHFFPRILGAAYIETTVVKLWIKRIAQGSRTLHKFS